MFSVSNQSITSHINLTKSPSIMLISPQLQPLENTRSIIKAKLEEPLPRRDSAAKYSRRVTFSPSLDKSNRSTKLPTQTNNPNFNRSDLGKNDLIGKSPVTSQKIEEEIISKRQSLSRQIQGSINFNKGPKRVSLDPQSQRQDSVPIRQSI